MTLPRIFADVPTGALVPGGDLDDDLDQVGSMGIMPCGASGTNNIALVPFTGLPDITAYEDYLRFAFVAAATSTGSVTVNFDGLGAKKWFAADGTTQLGAGQVAINEFYDIVFIQALDSGAGGFISAAASSAPSGPVGPHSIHLSNIVQVAAHTILGNPNAITADVEAMDRTTYLTEILGTPTPSLVAGPGIAITNTWPDQTVSFTGVPNPLADGQLNVAGLIEADGTVLFGLNIASVTPVGNGLYTVTFAVPFDSAAYACTVSGEESGGTFVHADTVAGTRLAASIQVQTTLGISSPEKGNGRFSIMASGVSSVPAYHANAVNFNNPTGALAATVYLHLAAALTGASDSSVGVFSVWVKQSTDTIMSSLMAMLADFQSAGQQTTNFMLFANGDTGFEGAWSAVPDTDREVGRTALGSVAVDVWTNVLASWVMNAAAGSRTVAVYLNDLAQTFTPTDDVGSAFMVPYSTAPSWTVGALAYDDPATDIENGFVGDMADLQFYPGVTLDLSVAANRRLFISSTGKPVSPAIAVANLGTPAILFSGNAATFPINQGSGGTFTLVGSLSNSSTSPSD